MRGLEMVENPADCEGSDTAGLETCATASLLMNAKNDPDRAAVRVPAVAGQFYPADPGELRAEVNRYVAAARVTDEPIPKAVIAPHAGYMFSGPIAGSVYARLARGRDSLRRVVLLGPSHHVGFPGLAVSTARAFESPLGLVPVDEAALERAHALPAMTTLDRAHQHEHSLEVQLPFLQAVLRDFKLVPLLVGDAAPAEVGRVLEALWGGAETCVVISSDLSHYLTYKEAQSMDQATARAIENLEEEALHSDQACGCRPIRGLLWVAKARGLSCRTVDLRNSGDTSGRRDRVVGYGGFVFN